MMATLYSYVEIVPFMIMVIMPIDHYGPENMCM